MKVAILFSGGKDSSLALHKARRFHDVVCLISLIPESQESYMFHVPNIELTKAQAKAMELPLIQKRTKGEKEKELEDLKKAIILAREKFGIEGVVTGAIRSIYQAGRVQRVCDEIGLCCINPLWLSDPIEILNEIVRNNFEVIISGVFAYSLDEDYLGKVIDEKMIEKLRLLKEEYNLNPAGEGGELETTVMDAPFFKKKLKILDHEVSYAHNSGIFKIKKVRLIGKC